MATQNLIYGGVQIPQWPIIDKIYDNLTMAKENAETDEVLIGRFILIKYCETEFLPSQKVNIEDPNYVKGDGTSQTDEYRQNFDIDITQGHTVSKDRLILQKQAFYDETLKRYVCEYREMCYLNQADIAELNGCINETRTKLNAEIQTRKELQDRVELFLDDAEGASETIDTLKEIQNWIDVHGTEATALTLDVQALGRVLLIETTSSNFDNDVNLINTTAEELSLIPQRGHIAIVIHNLELNENGNYVYNAYVYEVSVGQDNTNGTWQAMQGTYRAEDVYFNEDLTTTYELGKYTLTNGQATIPATGKNLTEVFNSIYQKELNPRVTAPTASLVLNGNTLPTVYEVGATTEEITYAIGFNPGAYQYGPALTGVSAAKYLLSRTNAPLSEVTSTGTLGTIELEPDKTYRWQAQVSYNDNASIIPVTNMGTEVPSLRIKDGNTAIAYSPTLSSYREGCFYGVVADTPMALTNSNIRDLLNKTGKNYESAILDLHVPVGTAQIIIACPANQTGVIQIQNTVANADMLNRFTITLMDITGDNSKYAIPYKIWSFIPPEAYLKTADLQIHLG